MKYLQGEEKEEAIGCFKRASEIALNSTCYRARCGSVIIKNGEIKETADKRFIRLIGKK